jgi:hypothetical protein
VGGPARRPEGDVDHHLQARLVGQADGAIQVQPVGRRVRGRVAGVEVGTLRRVGIRGDHRPRGGQADPVHAQPADRGQRLAHLVIGAVQEMGVVLDHRLRRGGPGGAGSRAGQRAGQGGEGGDDGRETVIVGTHRAGPAHRHPFQGASKPIGGWGGGACRACRDADEFPIA